MGVYLMALWAMLQDKNIFLGATVLVTVVAGVLLGEAIIGALEGMSGWYQAGLAFVIIGLGPLIMSSRFLWWPWWVVIIFGGSLIMVGFILG